MIQSYQLIYQHLFFQRKRTYYNPYMLSTYTYMTVPLQQGSILSMRGQSVFTDSTELWGVHHIPSVWLKSLCIFCTSAAGLDATGLSKLDSEA